MRDHVQRNYISITLGYGSGNPAARVGRVTLYLAYGHIWLWIGFPEEENGLYPSNWKGRTGILPRETSGQSVISYSGNCTCSHTLLLFRISLFPCNVRELLIDVHNLKPESKLRCRATVGPDGVFGRISRLVQKGLLGVRWSQMVHRTLSVSLLDRPGRPEDHKPKEAVIVNEVYGYPQKILVKICLHTRILHFSSPAVVVSGYGYLKKLWRSRMDLRTVTIKF